MVGTAEAQAVELTIAGLHCPSCAASLQRHLEKLDGVKTCQVHFSAGRIGIDYDPERITLPQIESALQKIGHPVRQRRADGRTADSARSPRKLLPLTVGRLRLLTSTLAGLLVLIGFVALWTEAPRPLWIMLCAVSMASSASFIAPGALAALRSRHAADIHVLTIVAAVGAAALGDWTEAATLLFLFSVAEALEEHCLDRTRQAVRDLVELAPEEVTVWRHGQETSQPAQEVAVGEAILVRPGSRVPLDGTVLEGRSSVNEAAITGESLPTAKGPGDAVYAGTLNEHGRLLLRVTHVAADTTLARIVALVEEAQARRSPTEKLVDRFARYYTPAILGLAAVLAVLPALLGGDPGSWIYRALTLLIVACPCALVISTPVAVVCSLARAARGGVLIKGGAHLERLGALKALAFDKTGTLTHGQGLVTDLLPLDGARTEELLVLAASVEHGSEHALGHAIVRAAAAAELPLQPADDFEAVPGLGVRARLNGAEITMGKPEWLREMGLATTPVDTRVAELQSEGKSVVLVGRENALIGLIAIRDQSRATGAAVMRAVRGLGIDRIAMLTGDNPATARAVAEEMGITEYHAGLMPAEKVACVERLRAEAGEIAMVGDGINDAPALAAATVGIAMGAAGTDVAIETADVALMGDDLSRLPFVIALSRRTVRTIRQNIVFSLAVKTAFILLTLAGYSPLWLAVLADTGTSVLVVINSLRLLRSPDHGLQGAVCRN